MIHNVNKRVTEPRKLRELFGPYSVHTIKIKTLNLKDGLHNFIFFSFKQLVNFYRMIFIIVLKLVFLVSSATSSSVQYLSKLYN